MTLQAGAKVVSVPVKNDRTELNDFINAITDNTKIIWFCNPNNPLGSMIEHDEDLPKRVIENNTDGLSLYYKTLDELGLNYIRSHGNFIMFDTGIDSDTVVDYYLKKGILLRGGKEFGRPKWLRVTIGTSEENLLVLENLRELISKK